MSHRPFLCFAYCLFKSILFRRAVFSQRKLPPHIYIRLFYVYVHSALLSSVFVVSFPLVYVLSYHFLPVICSASPHPVFSNVNTLNPSSPLGTVILILNLTICLSLFLSLSNPPPHTHKHTHTHTHTHTHHKSNIKISCYLFWKQNKDILENEAKCIFSCLDQQF